MTLTERLRAATGPDRYLFDEAWQKIKGNTYVGDHKQRLELVRFLALIEAEAWLDAALILLPDGCWLSWLGQTRPNELFGAILGLGEGKAASGEAATPAIALLLAICQAEGIE